MIFLYKDQIRDIVSLHKWITLGFCWGLTCIYWFVPQSNGGFAFVTLISLIAGAWLCFAIGTNGSILNNRISYLHLQNYIDNAYFVYWLSCILTICGAIAFSHTAKFYILPSISKAMLLIKKSV